MLFFSRQNHTNANAEAVFDKFLSFVDKMRDTSIKCFQCGDRDSWGCAVCLFRHHCPQFNDALVASMGDRSWPFKELQLRAPRPSSGEQEAEEKPSPETWGKRTTSLLATMLLAMQEQEDTERFCANDLNTPPISKDAQRHSEWAAAPEDHSLF